MAIILTCLCGKRLQVADELAGKKGKCPGCSRVLDIPARSVDPVDVNYAAFQPVPQPMAPMYPAATDLSVGPPADIPPIPPPLPPGYGAPVEPAPPQPVVNHNRDPLPEDLDFFAACPPEIGPLQSAYTSLTLGRQPLAPGVRLASIFTPLVVGLLLAALFISARLGGVAFIVMLAALPVSLIIWAVTRFRHRCTYVGQLGVARYYCRGRRENITGNMFLFADATELRTSQTRHYYNGAYTGTEYRYTWTDFHGQRVFNISGRYHSAKGNPKAKDPYHFAVAAEIAWSVYLLRQAPPQLADGGSIRFGLRGSDCIRLGDGFISLTRKGETITLRGDEIGRIRIQQGVVAILEPDAREGWFSSSGVYKFAYAELANAQFFIILIEHLFGVRPNG